MKKLLLATKNKGKLQWISKFLKDLPVELVSLSDLGIVEDIEENEETYIKNSQKKALFYAKLSGLPTIGDDSGLEIDALNGEPGVKSRRWIGYEATDEELIEHMKKISLELPDNNRRARYRAVVSFALPNGNVWSEEGISKGVIAKKPDLGAEKGLPYNAFFYLPEIQKYYHQLSEDEYRQYNHRYRAIQKLKPIIKKVLSI